jgi:hypothetical protein
VSGILRTYRVNTSARTVEFFLDRDPKDPRFDLDQPYQRGVVWGLRRKQSLIKSILMGVPIPAIIINDRFEAGFRHPGYDQDRRWAYAIVDGKQRVTAIQQFVDNQFEVPYEWFYDDGAHQRVRWHTLALPEQRKFRNQPLAVAVGQFPNLELERELFDLINFGGLTQGEVDDD